MIEEKIINAPEGAKYVGDFMKELPIGILNKEDTGCGATTLAIQNDKNTVICGPGINLIFNKVAQFPNPDLKCEYSLLGVMEGVTTRDIQRYVAECKEKGHPVKIMVTYDSFGKVKNAIPDINDYRIVVDEYQELLKAYSYREKAIRKLLKDIEGIEKVTFLSATPIPYDFVPEELKNLTAYRIDWGKSVRCKPKRIKTNKPYLKAKNIISDHKAGCMFELDGKTPKELYFFVNSVKGIKTIIDEVGLTNEEVRVICANNDENKKTLENIEISTTASANKPYTFCTSTVFYGSDFYSESGLIVIVSDGRNPNTQLDISTDIIQIAGRIRNEKNPFKNIIIHIYSTTKKPISKETFYEKLNGRIQSAEIYKNAFDNADEIGKESLAERINPKNVDEYAFYDKETNSMSINDMKINYAKYKFESVDEVYKNGVAIREAYAKAGMDMSEAGRWEYITEDYCNDLIKRNYFKDMYLEYLAEIEKMPFNLKTQRAKRIEQQYPTISKIAEFITPEEVAKLNYNITRINKLLNIRLPKTKDAIRNKLSQIFKVGFFYPLAYIKTQFKHIYNELLIDTTPTAKDIFQHYSIEEAKETVNGKRENGYRITDKMFCCFAFRK